ncbi:MAG: zinc-ribbon domain-containing protein, partial [Ilumatobacteraceae bacterium]
MIICKECGHQNEDDDLFCGNCPAFLEYSGERVGGPEPEPEVLAEPSQHGLVTR